MLKSQIRSMLSLQEQLNSLINSDWRSRRHPWHRAIFVESAELLDHIGWKWWKHQQPDVPQAQIELVDIWHFILSDALQRADIESAATALHADWHSPRLPLNLFDLQSQIEQFAATTVKYARPDTTAFKHLCDGLELSSSQLYHQYVAKNVLNVFRQQNGYKEGSYIKVWRGHEDNVWLENLLTKKPEAKPDELMAELKTMYAQVLESQ